MKKMLLITMLILSLTLCCGCFEEEVSSEDEHFYCETAIDELETENEMLKERVEELEYQVEDMQNTIWDIEDYLSGNY